MSPKRCFRLLDKKFKPMTLVKHLFKYFKRKSSLFGLPDSATRLAHSVALKNSARNSGPNSWYRKPVVKRYKNEDFPNRKRPPTTFFFRFTGTQRIRSFTGTKIKGHKAKTDTPMKGKIQQTNKHNDERERQPTREQKHTRKLTIDIQLKA